MTRKDFELIANTIKAQRAVNGRTASTSDCYAYSELALSQLVERFCTALAETNERFNVERFRKACDPDS